MHISSSAAATISISNLSIRNVTACSSLNFGDREWPRKNGFPLCL